MITRDALSSYLQAYLACDDYQDYAPNGLQVEGRSEIRRIATAVTASFAEIQAAVAFGADALLVHHGYFWNRESAVITGMKRHRIALLLQNALNLYAYHLPLDGHVELGNNACLGQRLSLKNVQSHAIDRTPNLLWSGQLASPMSAFDLSAFITEQLQREPLCLLGTTKPIHRIAWCSGGAQDLIEHAHRLGADAYLSGEASERTYYQAKELGLYYFACGHHATERYGIQALGAHLVAQFGVEHLFIDSENPV